MRRGGGFVFGILATLGIGASAFLGLAPLLFREKVKVLFVADNPSTPSGDAIQSGFRFALDERGSRLGRFRVEGVLTDNYSSLWIPGKGGGTYYMDLPHEAPEVLGIVGIDTPYIDKTNISIPMVWCSGDRSEEEEPQGRYCVIPALEEQGRNAAKWALRTGARRILVLGERFKDRSGAIARGFLGEVRALGGALVQERLLDDQEPPPSAEILGDAPDLLFFTGEAPPYSRAWEIFTALRSAGYSGRLLLADASVSVSFLAAPGRLVEGCHLVSSLAPPPPEFVGPYREFAGKDPGPHVYYGYLAGRAILEAIDQARSRRRDKIRAGLASSPCFDRRGESTLPCALYAARNGKFEFVERLK
jgi:hypothetical protein